MCCQWTYYLHFHLSLQCAMLLLLYSYKCLNVWKDMNYCLFYGPSCAFPLSYWPERFDPKIFQKFPPIITLSSGGQTAALEAGQCTWFQCYLFPERNFRLTSYYFLATTMKTGADSTWGIPRQLSSAWRGNRWKWIEKLWKSGQNPDALDWTQFWQCGVEAENICVFGNDMERQLLLRMSPMVFDSVVFSLILMSVSITK